jgi:serine phosphatase RsbU (regulator of sigma subunit)/lipopolysaccharide biosynthesis regulator YciM
MRFSRFLVLLLSLFFLQPAHAQKHADEDSLWRVYNNPSTPDSVKLTALYDLSWQMNFANPDSGIVLAKIHLELAKKTGNRRAESAAYNTMGVACINKNDLDNALIYHEKSLKIRQELKDKKGEAVSLNNIGIVYNYKGDVVTSIDCYQRSLKLKQEIGDMAGVAAAYSNIGQLYLNQGLNETALTYMLASLHIRDSLKDMRGIEDSYIRLASYYGTLKEYEKSIEYTRQSIVIGQELQHKKILANSYYLLGVNYKELNQLDSAQKNLEIARDMRIEMDDVEGLGDAYESLGEIQLVYKNYKKAIELCTKGLEYAGVDFPEVEQEACDCLQEAYEGTGDYAKALKYLRRYNTLNDSLNTLEKAKNVSRKIFQFEFEKRAFEDSLRLAKVEEVKEVKRKEEIRQQQIYTIAGVIGFVLMVIIAFVLFRGYRAKQKNNEALELKNKIITDQKLEVEDQKALVEEKNKAVLDSINYAQRLQLAILPSEKSWNEVFPNSFIFYRPKDIVAGDFYWVQHSHGLILFAAADCTGHGVPGALVSVVCSNALNRAVKEFDLTDPGKILDKVTELVLETFANSEKEVSDGMDISLCVLDPKTNSLKWSGANNPVWYLSQGKMNTVPANKQPVGKSDDPVPFITHHIQLAKGDTIYLFTDGFADQFGGPRGKKFKYKPFQEHLFDNSSKSMKEQERSLHETFEAWRGNLEQVDDVCVIGIRVG